MRTTRLVVGGMVAVATLVTAAPAMAVDTTATFTVFAGAVSVTAPTSKNFGFVLQGGSVSDTLGEVEVTDSRDPSPGTWTATVSSTDFTNGGNTFAASNVTYTPGACTTTGTVTCTPASAFALSNSAQTAVTGSGSVAGSTASWNPTFSFTVPAGQVVGAYTATVTHSVA